MSWRVAKSLEVLRHQIDARWPGRDKSSDGGIGNEEHQSRDSDHNAWIKDGDFDVVSARDFTHDPKHGLDARKLSEAIVASRDGRVKYLISNREICAGTGQTNKAGKPIPPWVWRPYNGKSDHRHHNHVSVKSDKAHYDNETPWVIGEPDARLPQEPDPKPEPQPPLSGTPDLRLRMAKAIIDYEARRDKNGHLVVYKLPANDGGGRYEVAGINEKYDKPKADELVKLVEAGKFSEAELVAQEYIASNTDSASKLTTVPSVEFYLRDCVFNRGATGAVKILQMAIGFKGKFVDGDFGGLSKARMDDAQKVPQELLTDLRAAREEYERVVVGYRKNFWQGLVNRWDKALVTARTFPDTVVT